MAVATVLWLKDVGIADKFVQQDEDDQEVAFHKAFTLNILWTLLFCLLIAVLAPVFALVYGQPEIIVPVCVMALGVFATAFDAPAWVLHRQMRFARERTLLAIEPLVGFAVTIGAGRRGPRLLGAGDRLRGGHHGDGRGLRARLALHACG